MIKYDTSICFGILSTITLMFSVTTMDYKIDKDSLILAFFLVLITFILVPAFLLIAGASGTLAASPDSPPVFDHIAGQIDGAYHQATTYDFLEKEESLLLKALRKT